MLNIPLTLPQGEDAALVPGVEYSVPGLFRFSGLVYECIREVEARFGYRLPIRYLYGSPRMRWNCGRILIRDHPHTEEDIRAELTGAAEHGITPLLTFSNPLLTEEDLTDPLGNLILDILNEVKGGVIVANGLLQEYVRRGWPDIEIHASVILTSFSEHRDQAYYEALSQRYDRYVVHTDDNLNPALLLRVPKENAEILLNEPCGYQCPRRRQHYLSIARGQKAIADGERLVENFLDACPFVPEGKQSGSKVRPITRTAEDTVMLAAMGFRLFKLQGRLDSPYVVFYDLLRYTLENRVAFPAMYPVFTYAIQEYMKEQERRKAAGRDHSAFRHYREESRAPQSETHQ